MSLVSARILEEEIAIDLIARSEARGQDVAFKDQLRDRLDKLRTRGLHAAARISGCMYNSHVVVSVGNEVAVHTAWQVPIDEEAVDAFVSTFPTEPYPAGDRTQESFMELVCDKLLNRTPVCDPLVEDYASWAWFFCLSALRGARKPRARVFLRNTVRIAPRGWSHMMRYATRVSYSQNQNTDWFLREIGRLDPESGSDFLRGEIDYAMNAFDGMDPYMSAYALMGMRIALGLVPDFVPNLPWRT